jgi:hypothetical protein
MSQTTNYFVAFSNLIAIPLMFGIRSSHKYIMLCPMFASILYHLAERKHGLSGIHPFNLYHVSLLWLDRIAAFLSGAIVLKAIYYYYPHIITWQFVGISIASLVFLWLSERDTWFTMIYGRRYPVPELMKVEENEFAVFHAMWHVLAFCLLAFSIKQLENEWA